MYSDKNEQRRCWREWYHRNRDAELKRRKVGGKKRRAAQRAWFREYKATLKCKRCPERHIACLDFHHRDPKRKTMSIAKALSQMWSMERLMLEISKCDVLCSNCHRKLHWRFV